MSAFFTYSVACVLFILDAELFISGESYAGFYIPWIAEHIVRSQLVPDARGDLVRNLDLGEYSSSFCALVNSYQRY